MGCCASNSSDLKNRTTTDVTVLNEPSATSEKAGEINSEDRVMKAPAAYSQFCRRPQEYTKGLNLILVDPKKTEGSIRRFINNLHAKSM